MEGGNLEKLLKGALGPSKFDNYGDILVSDCSGKRLHSWVRSRYEGLYQGRQAKAAHGVKGLGADMCHHISASWWGYLRAQGLSGAQLFADVSAAFPSVV